MTDEPAEYSPGALSALIDKIAMKAIKTNLEMLSPFGWEGSVEAGFTGSGWVGALPPVSGPTGPVRISYTDSTTSQPAAIPPGAVFVSEEINSEKDFQRVITYELDPWEVLYRPYIDRVHEVFDKWLEIPMSSDFEGISAQARKAGRSLVVVDNGPGGRGDVEVGLQSSLRMLGAGWNDAGASPPGVSGQFIEEFRRQYAFRVEGVMANQSLIGFALHAIIEGNRAIWESAGQSLMAIADAADHAMKPGGMDHDFALMNGLNLAKKVVGLIPGTIGKVGARLVDAGDFIARVLPDGAYTGVARLRGGHPDQVLSSVEDALVELDKTIYAGEESLAVDTADGSREFMYSSEPDNFHIHPDPGTDEYFTQAAPTISLNLPSVRNLGHVDVPIVSGYMARAAEHAQAANDPYPFLRPQGIGYGPVGPYYAWVKLQEEFDKVTTGSAAEFLAAGELLAQAGTDLANEDDRQQMALRGVRDALERGEFSWSGAPEPQPPRRPFDPRRGLAGGGVL